VVVLSAKSTQKSVGYRSNHSRKQNCEQKLNFLQKMLYSKIEGQSIVAKVESNLVKPLLILHGFLGMSDNWKTLSTQYVSEGFEVHTIDLRNHGRSFHSSDFSYEIMVQDMFEYCQANGLSNVNLIGHSMGGKIAMLFATTHPEMVNKLIIADIGPKFYPQHHQTILAGLNAVDFSKKPSRNQVDEIVKNYIPDFGTRQFLLKNLFWQTSEQLAFRFNLEVFNSKIEEIGKALPSRNIFSKSTLFIRGGNSNYILDEDLNEIKQHFPLAILETIPNVGHWLHAENPKLFFEKTLKFLKN
jgi:esterase